MDESWLEVLGDEFEKPRMKELKKFLAVEMKKFKIYPPGKEIFNAFNHTPFNKVKVVILGQDPYHGEGQAHGLCFSVAKGVASPPSLKNIFREITRDLGIVVPTHGCLTHWAKQGVFLLNTVLTVRQRAPQSHASKGWEEFTSRAIFELNERREKLVFLLWGRSAREKLKMIDTTKHLVLETSHPSPLSAYNGFTGCGHFSELNEYLEKNGIEPIDWSLPEEDPKS